MEAKDYFFREAYFRNEDERSNWEKEVAEQIKKEYEIDTFDELIKKLEDIELKYSNNLIIDKIIGKYLEKESNPKIRKIVKKFWIGSWDSPDFVNAQVQTEHYYDDSHLAKVTTELQVQLRRLCDLFSIVLYMQSGKIEEKANYSNELAAMLVALQIKDIKYDTDDYVTKGISLVPENFARVYQLAFNKAYQSGLTFVVFHEIGHVLELDNEIATLYGTTPSWKCKNIEDRKQQKEWNADSIGIFVVNKMYGDVDVTRWISVCGILMVYITFALAGQPILDDTEHHPALVKRFRNTKQTLYNWLDNIEQKLVDYHMDMICSLLQRKNFWKETDWWK